MTDNERRRSPRVPCHEVWLTIKIGEHTGITQLQELPARQVRVDNTSDSGICLISTDPFELGQIIYFLDTTLPAQGEVVWTSQSKIECKAGIHYHQR